MKMVYVFWITFEYDRVFKGTFVHGFESKSSDKKNIEKVAKRYLKKHYIPARIVNIDDPKLELLVKVH